MNMASATKKKKSADLQFGDFQTPLPLAIQACDVLKSLGVRPAAIVEPTCGIGAFLVAATQVFPDCQQLLGFDIHPEYVAATQRMIASVNTAAAVSLKCQNFFKVSWKDVLGGLPSPVLLLGNPPWVTNSDQGAGGGANLPEKSNFQGHAGLDAITGKSNFDISEFMLTRLLHAVVGRPAFIGMLVKTAVARKALAFAWKHYAEICDAAIYQIDAAEHFGAAVDACFLYLQIGTGAEINICRVYQSLADVKPSHSMAYEDCQLVSNRDAYSRGRHLHGMERVKWRSGIKHDCASVMELTRTANGCKNALGETVPLEPDCLYPMLKSSDVANGNTTATGRYMLVPQKSTGEQILWMQADLPLTWNYLLAHGAALDARGSSIYRNRPRFSIFGVGPYSFAPWKIAISGFYKSLDFRVVGPIEGKPVVMDDTVNFLPFHSRESAEFFCNLLNSPPASDFFRGSIFWDAKRPVTVDILRRLDLLRLADACGQLALANRLIRDAEGCDTNAASDQPNLFSGA